MRRQEGNNTLVWDVCIDTRLIKHTSMMRKRSYGAEWIRCSAGGFSECGDKPMGFMNARNFLTGWRTIHNSRKSPYYTVHFLDSRMQVIAITGPTLTSSANEGFIYRVVLIIIFRLASSPDTLYACLCLCIFGSLATTAWSVLRFNTDRTDFVEVSCV
jgi:hypothetical protein